MLVEFTAIHAPSSDSRETRPDFRMSGAVDIISIGEIRHREAVMVDVGLIEVPHALHQVEPVTSHQQANVESDFLFAKLQRYGPALDGGLQRSVVIELPVAWLSGKYA